MLPLTHRISARNEILTLDDGHKLTLSIVGASDLPILLFVVGSSGLGKLYHRLAVELSQHLQCIYYDRRGFSLARPSNPFTTFTPTSHHANDAAAVIKHLSPTQPVYAFGTSTGGTVVLELLMKHEHLLHTTILHEPIVLSIVPVELGRAEIVAEYQRIAAIADPLEAQAEFARAKIFSPSRSNNALASSQPGRRDTMPESTAQRPSRPRLKTRKPSEVHNARQMQLDGLAMLEYRIDMDQARRLRDKIVILGGIESRNMPVSVPGRALADALDGDKRVWDVPGGHVSFAGRTHVEVFAARLLDVLGREGRLELRAKI